MGAFSGLGNHKTTGNVGVAIIAGVGGNLAFQNFETDTDNDLTSYLTINGNLEKRKIGLGALPQSSGSFNVSFPNGTDISYFNTVVVLAGEEGIGEAKIP
ncbi:MAG: hypothetical protein AB8B99_16915 [Phormidesmis sp.]